MKKSSIILVIAIIFSIVQLSDERQQKRNKKIKNSNMSKLKGGEDKNETPSKVSTKDETGLKSKTDENCGNVIKILSSISDMVLMEVDSTKYQSISFQSKIMFSELIKQEIIQIYEYYNMKILESSMIEIERTLNDESTLKLSAVWINSLYKKFVSGSNELLKYFMGQVQFMHVYVVRMQMYSAIKMYSMLYNFEQTLKVNHMLYEKISIAKRPFDVVVDFNRLYQIDRLLAKGVLYLITEQINQVYISNVMATQGMPDDIGQIQIIYNLFYKYYELIQEIKKNQETQMMQLEILQKIQYQYNVNIQNQYYIISSQTMQTISTHLYELIVKDINQHQLIKIDVDIFRKFNNEITINQLTTVEQIINIKDCNVLDSSVSTNLESTKNFIETLFSSQEFIWEQNSKYDQSRINSLLINFNQYVNVLNNIQTDLISNNIQEVTIVNQMGLNVKTIEKIQVMLFVIKDFLSQTKNRCILTTQIESLINIETEKRMEQIFYPVMTSFVALKVSYENLVRVINQMGILLQSYASFKSEYQKVYDDFYKEFLSKLLVQQVTMFKERMELLSVQIYQDFLQITIEIRNYRSLFDQVTKIVIAQGVTTNIDQTVLDILQKNYQQDIEQFYTRMQVRINNLFIHQVNIIASIRTLQTYMFTKLVKNFYYFEKTLHFLSQNIQYETLFFNKIEKTAFWFEDVLAKKTRNINQVFIKFMIKRVQLSVHQRQKFIRTPFEILYDRMSEGLISKVDIIRIDQLLLGSNGLEMELIANRDAFLITMEKHHCQLINIYQNFQKELYVVVNTAVKSQINYVDFIQRIRANLYLQLSDIEVVKVDINDENYFNTINQLKIQGYDEYTLQNYEGDNKLLKLLESQKKLIDGQSKTVSFRMFYCQGCFNRVMVDQLYIYEYTKYDYEGVVEEVKQEMARIQSQYPQQLCSEINIISYYDDLTRQEVVFYLVKIYYNFQAIKLIQTTSSSLLYAYSQEALAVSNFQLSKTTVSKTSITSLVINVNCALLSVQQTLKHFSIFQQTITNSQYEIDSLIVRDSIDSITEEKLIDFKLKNHQLIELAYNNIYTNFKNILSIFNLKPIVKTEQSTIFTIFSLNRKESWQSNTNSIYDVIKIVYGNYMEYAQLQILYEQYKIEYNIVKGFTNLCFLKKCIRHINAATYISEINLQSIRDYFNKETVQIVDFQKVMITSIALFKNPYWIIGWYQSLGKLYSKILNVIPNIGENNLFGNKLDQIDFKTHDDYLKYFAQKYSIVLSNQQKGLNYHGVDIISYNDNKLTATTYLVSDQKLRLFYSEFKISKNDIKYTFIQEQMKLHFMFPFKLDNEHIKNANIRGNKLMNKEIINKMNEENNYYTIYIGRMEEAIEKQQLLEIFISQDKETMKYKHDYRVMEKDSQSNEIIDNEYIVTEVFYYLEGERNEQYIQDLLAVNSHDPFYQNLIQLGFRVVTASGKYQGESIHGFYDFTLPQSQSSSNLLDSQPLKGMKRIWVRSRQIQLLEKAVAISFPLTNINIDNTQITVQSLVTSFIKSDYQSYKNKIISALTSTLLEDHFIQRTQQEWVGQAILNYQTFLKYFDNSQNTYADPNQYIMNEYIVTTIQEREEEKTTTTTGKEIEIAREYYLFMKSLIENIQSFSINNIGLYSQYDLDSNLFTSISTSRQISTYQFDSNYVIPTPSGSTVQNVIGKDIISKTVLTTFQQTQLTFFEQFVKESYVIKSRCYQNQYLDQVITKFTSKQITFTYSNGYLTSSPQLKKVNTTDFHHRKLQKKKLQKKNRD